MAGVVVLLVAVLISIVVTRIATVALTMTGLSGDLARFQARSAFSGVGFTTSEADQMTSHPARRRIVMILMLIGNAGLVTAVASIVSATVNTGDLGSALLRGTVLVSGLLTLSLFTRSQRVESLMRRGFERILQRWTSLEVHDYDALLDLTGAYTVVEIEVGRDEWLVEHPLGDLDLPDEGVTVLAVRRGGGRFLGAPGGEVVLEPGDTLVVYGHEQALQEVAGRRGGASGEAAHDRSVERHRQDRLRSPKNPSEPESQHREAFPKHGRAPISFIVQPWTTTPAVRRHAKAGRRHLLGSASCGARLQGGRKWRAGRVRHRHGRSDIRSVTTKGHPMSNQPIVSTVPRPSAPPLFGDIVYRFQGELGPMNPVGLFAEGIRFFNQFEGRLVDGPFAGGRISGPDFFVLRHDGIGEIHAPELIELDHHRVALDVRGYVVPPDGVTMPPLTALLEPGFEFPDVPFRVTASALASTTSPEFAHLNGVTLVVEGEVNMGTGALDVTARVVDRPRP